MSIITAATFNQLESIREYILTKLPILNTKEIGLMRGLMERESKILQKELTKEITLKDKSMDMEYISGQMELVMKAIFQKDVLKVREPTKIQTITILMMESIVMIFGMVRE